MKKIGNKKEIDFYRGSYTADEINRTSDLQITRFDRDCSFSFIVNTLVRNDFKNMGHWLAIGLFYSPNLNRMELKFIDSFAQHYRSYNDYIKNYIDSLRVKCYEQDISFKLDTLELQIQSFGTDFCGGYVCFGVVELFKSRYKSVSALFKNFNTNTKKKNDKHIATYINRNWPQKICRVRWNSKEYPLKIPLALRKNMKLGKSTNFCPKITYGHNKCLRICNCDHGLCCG